MHFHRIGPVFGVFGFMGSGYGQEFSEGELEKRVERLEDDARQRENAGLWAERVALSGVLEVEAFWEEEDPGSGLQPDEASSDLVLATMAVGLDVDIAPYVSGHTVFLWEEDDTEPVDMDEGYIRVHGGGKTPFAVSAGKMYLPFGSYETDMISDPLTLELGEVRESALQLEYQAAGFYGSVYGFNGAMDAAGEENHLDSYGAAAGYVLENRSFDAKFGMSYISNLLDSDGWGEHAAAEMAGTDAALADEVPGIAVHAVLGGGPLKFTGEYVSALEAPEWAGNPPDGVGDDRIAAWNAELGCFFTVMGRGAHLALSWQESRDADGFLPERKVLGSVGSEIFPAVHLALEYARASYETDAQRDMVTVQLATVF
jgi:hypothetical protein